MDGPDPSKPGLVAALRRALLDADYAEESIRRALALDAGAGAQHRDRAMHLRRVAEPAPLNTLIKLFILGVPVPPAEAETALRPLGIEGAAELGVVSASPEGIRRVVSIASILGGLLAHDPFEEDPSKIRRDLVIGPGPASLTLAALTVRVPVASALDLGTGSGVQGMVAARHADRVVATDTNPRAVRFARFNALLNESDGIDCREGSLYEPVDGERFGLIVANPPFVISPEQRFEYRDSELRGDEISRQVVRGAADHLEPGGFACVLCNWAMGPGEEWSAPLRRWLDGTPVDAWLMHKDIQDTLAYADTWLVGPTGEEYDRALGEWMEYYRELGIEAVGTGTVILRGRAAGPGWIREAHVPATKSPEATKHILRVFHNHDFLQSLTGVADLLAGAYRVTPDLRVEQVMSWRDGAYEVERSDLSFENGLALTGPTDTDFLRILVACDGARTLSDIIREVAPALGMEPAVVEPAAAEVVRGMLSLGFLEAPASGSA